MEKRFGIVCGQFCVGMEKEQDPAAGQSGPVIELGPAAGLAALNPEPMTAGQGHGLVTAAAIDNDDLAGVIAHQRLEPSPVVDLVVFIEGGDDDGDV